MSTAYWVTGDTRAVTAHIPDGSIDLILTSPPFLALRSYLPADDPNKGLEIGSEATPGAFIDVLLDLTVEWRRILAPHGSICVELGDTYSGSGGAGGDYADEGLREGQPKFRADRTGPRDSRPGREGPATATTPRPESGANGGTGWPLAKSLTLIPESYRMALAYGRNPHTGRTIQPWRIRNVVRWVRPNPPVGALGDKFRPATSEMVVACVSGKRYFDLDAVRTPYKGNHKMGEAIGGKGADYGDGVRSGWSNRADVLREDRGGAPPLDWWNIPTHGFAGAHYATWPPALCTKPILSMCPEKVCTVCGEPSRRIVGEAEYVPSATNRGGILKRDGERAAEGVNQWSGNGGATASVIRVAPTLGFTDCDHDAWRPGRVLDPFGGSGTTCMVTTGHGRDAIGIDLDHRNAELARDRIGPLFFTETTATELGELLR